jgi:hypothetical protein
LALPSKLDETSFAYRDITGQDLWTQFTPTFTSLTVVGSPSYFGRLRVDGKLLRFQVQFSAGTSIASTAGSTYLDLPIGRLGLAGMGVMTNATTNIAVGVCHIGTAGCYLPTQSASANVFNIAGWYEIN